MPPGFEFEQRIQRQNARYGGQDQRHKQTVNRGDRAKENNPENAEQGNEGKKQRERQVDRYPAGIYSRNGGAVSPEFGNRPGLRRGCRASRRSLSGLRRGSAQTSERGGGYVRIHEYRPRPRRANVPRAPPPRRRWRSGCAAGARSGRREFAAIR